MTYPARRPYVTANQFRRMVETGVLTKADRVELLNGEIVAMSPINPRHSRAVNRAMKRLLRHVGDEAIVTVQNPIQLNDAWQPQPDLCVLEPRPDEYLSAHPLPNEVWLVIEVAESSAQRDRLIKQPAYAQAGIREYWIIDLTQDVIEVCTQPANGVYQNIRQVRRGETLVPQALPTLVLSAAELLG